jgi:hypothetical protein
MAAITYTVKKGDTLSQIAQKYDTTVDALKKLNNIANVNRIYVGQVLRINSEAPDKSPKPSKKYAIIEHFGLQSNSDRTMFATWKWDKTNTKEYKTKWEYYTGDKTWFTGSDSTVTEKESVYSAPSNAKKVRFKVLPVAKTYKQNGKTVSYWSAEWSTVKTYTFGDPPPSKPSVPTVTVKGFTLKAEVDNLPSDLDEVQFYIIKDNDKVCKKIYAKIKSNYASCSCSISAGHLYKVKCRGVRCNKKGDQVEWGDWTDHSANVHSVPSDTKVLSFKARSSTSIYIDWKKVTNADKYEIQYATNKAYFSSNPNEVKSVTIEDVDHAEITGLEPGHTYYFRIRAVNSQGNSGWTKVESIAIGTTPTAPTTWSSDTRVSLSDSTYLYWMHNCEDGSKATNAQIELYFNNTKKTITIAGSDLEEGVNRYAIDASMGGEISYNDVEVLWRVRTSGVTKKYGAWSTQRTINFYASPTLEIRMTDYRDYDLDDLQSFPFHVKTTTSPATQTPVGFRLSIVAKSGYTDKDEVGDYFNVTKGDELYSEFFDTDENLNVRFDPYMVNLRNNRKYTIKCEVVMDSGLSAKASLDFEVAYTTETYYPEAWVGIDTDDLVAYLLVSCEDESGDRPGDCELSVYRKEQDGSFTEICSGLDGSAHTMIVDPHPSLDVVRYRIVSTNLTNGAMDYFDTPDEAVGEPSIVFNYGEEWYDFEVVNEDSIAEAPWRGTVLRLPYNVDVSEDTDPDVELIKYIGRKHPVSYYGTHVGQTANWSAQIPKDDKETLQALRRLAVWMNDVYVREPSGTGYWANVKVSFGQTHRETTIPVSFNITRVEGGA